MGIFRTLVITFVLSLFVYISHQLTRFTDFTWTQQALIVAFIALLFAMVLGTFFYFFKDRSPEASPWKDHFVRSSMTIMAYINFLMSLVVIRDLFAFFQSALSDSALPLLYSSNATYALMGAPFVFLLLGRVVVLRGPRVKKLILKFQNLPQAFEGLRILHVTDLHISPGLPRSFVQNLVERISELQPDLVVYTGDILDSFAEKHTTEFQILATLKSSFGQYYVPGNHEYYWNIESGLKAFENIGMKVLLNHAATITKGPEMLQIAGIPDPAAGHFGLEIPNFEKLQAQLNPHSFKILLSHQPSLARQAEKHGFDLQLSGHTHGGQFFPWNYLIVFFQRYAKGLYRIGKMQLYVNQGTGYWGPQIRLGTYCEVTEIVLRKG